MPTLAVRGVDTAENELPEVARKQGVPYGSCTRHQLECHRVRADLEMLRLLLLGGLALAAECGPTVVTDGYFPEDYRVTLTQEIKSKHFDIVYGKNFKVVTNFHAREQYVLTHCGSTAPTDAEVPEAPDFRSPLNGAA